MSTIIRSIEFDEFYNSLPANVQNKVKYAMNVIAEVKVVNTKLIKKLVDTYFPSAVLCSSAKAEQILNSLQQ